MPMQIKCKRCDRLIEVRDGFDDTFIRCPQCGSYTTLPGAESTEQYGFEVPIKTCPSCALGIPVKAVICSRCGYDYRTRQVASVRRTVKPLRYGWGPNVALRLAVIGLLLPLALPVALFCNHVAAAASVLACWAVFLLLSAGSFPTLGLRRDRRGHFTLHTRQWVGFVPLLGRTRRLHGRTMSLELNLEGGGAGAWLEAVFANSWRLRIIITPAVALLYLYAMLAVGKCVLTLADDRGSHVQRSIIYRCRSESAVQEVADTICEVAGLSYS
jgi:hypothetical protein